jgi:uncharacterized protein DUF3592
MRLFILPHTYVDRDSDSWFQRVRYAYGAPSHGSARPEPRQGAFILDDGAAAIYDAFSVGDRVTVLYDPARPDRSEIYEFSQYCVRGAEERGAVRP